MMPEQMYFLQSPPEEDFEYQPDTSNQVSFVVSNKELCDEERELQVGKNEGHHEGTISVTNLQRREVRPFNKMVDGEDAYVLVC
ncbi:myb/SANT-like DNA-binding domain-containing protein 3 [Alligator mississippiensis]|uniref:Myb/SANT-like DNA-binding domain-containing protein 3 n=1 Tax=Alligator mississippiensis TaxID=8496 RepID=A0A151PHE1_ALLMI|nr:myb/SANT-like DNA-binding domain-containing protein 3 [Alligator mississippiensis]